MLAMAVLADEPTVIRDYRLFGGRYNLLLVYVGSGSFRGFSDIELWFVDYDKWRDDGWTAKQAHEWHKMGAASEPVLRVFGVYEVGELWASLSAVRVGDCEGKGTCDVLEDGARCAA